VKSAFTEYTNNYCKHNQDNVIAVENLEDPIPRTQSNNAIGIEKRRKATLNLENQAFKMKTWSDKKLKQAEVDVTVRIPVSDVDKSRGDARNILAVVIKVNIK